MTRAVRSLEGGIILTCSRYGSPVGGSCWSKGGIKAAAREGGGRGFSLALVLVPPLGEAAEAGAEAEAGKVLEPC